MGMGGVKATGGAAGALSSEINVTPMVDIMLVLLIIFMVITPLLQQGVQVTLPKGDNPDPDENLTREDAIVVSIPTDGIYYINRDQVPGKDALIEELKSRVAKLPESVPRIVYIRGGTNVNYGDIVEVVDAIRSADIQQIGLVAERRKPEQ
ncbi:MAG: ExbD/TolR family protein [Blastocatellia bacterium]|nr:ExbD/TolR family protein [Blastocatellia bacterium]